MSGSPAHPGRWALVVVSFIVGLTIASTLLDTRPPAPVAASAPEAEFSSERALAELQAFADVPRPIGSARSDEVRDQLAERLSDLGYDVRTESAVGGFTFDGFVTLGRVENVVATLPGRAPGAAPVVLAVHYDSVAAGPGANDAGVPVAAALETARALAAGPRPRNDIVILLTDGEESGLLGAAAFIEHDPLGSAQGVVLNNEARGAAGPALMFETARGNAALIELFGRTAPHPLGDSTMVETYRYMPNNTDFTAFTRGGWIGLNSAHIGESIRYHTPQDDLEHVSESTVQHHGANLLAMSRALGDTDLTTLRSEDDSTYFHVLGRFVSYPAGWALPLSAAALLAVVVAAVVGRHRRLLTIPRLLLAFPVCAVGLLLVAAAAQAIWPVLTSIRPEYRDLLIGDTYVSWPFRAAALTAALSVALLWYWPARRLGGPALAVAGAGLLAIGGLGLAVVAPGAAFVLSVPALVAAAGLLVAWLLPRASVAAVLAVSLPATLFLGVAALGMFDGVGLALAGVAGFLVGCWVLAMLPLAEWLFARRRRGPVLGALALVAATGLVAAGLGSDRFSPANPRPSTLSHVQDADAGEATWISYDRTPSAWVLDRTPDTTPHPRAALVDHPTRTGPAEPLDLAAPTVQVLADSGDEVRLRIQPGGQDVARLTLGLGAAVTSGTATVPGREPFSFELPSSIGSQETTIVFHDPPADGVDLTLHLAGDTDADLPVEVAATRLGLDGTPGYEPRPPAEARSMHAGSDVRVVTRAYTF